MKFQNRRTVLALATTALLCAACSGTPVKSGFLTQPIGPDQDVDLSWTAPGARTEQIERLVIVIPDSSQVLGNPDLGTVQREGMALIFADLLEKELSPDFQMIYKVQPGDARLNNPTGERDVAVLETRLVTIEPGNYWLRLLVSGGAGTTKLQIDGRLSVLGDHRPAMEWVARTGSWIPKSAESLLLSDLKELAADTARHVRARLGRVLPSKRPTSGA